MSDMTEVMYLGIWCSTFRTGVLCHVHILHLCLCFHKI